MSAPGRSAVVLVSGGMDSCVTLAEARAAGHEPALLHATYGQKTADRERRAFEAVADHYGVPPERRLVCALDALAKIGGSSLTDASMPVEDAAAGGAGAGGIPTSYVPFRNAHLLSAAVSWAEVLGAESVWIGAVEEDSSGYPDCREAFYRAFETLIDAGTRPETRLRVVTPLIRMSKEEIVRRGMTLEAPLHLTWSCYRETERACGRCESCALRLKGFASAGVEDPIP